MKATEKQKQAMRDYYRKNRKHRLEYQRKYRLAHLDEIRETKKIYAKKNKRKLAIYYRTRLQRRREEIKKQLGGKCFICGFNDHRALQINHKKVKSKSRTNTYQYLAKDYDLSMVELLCANCHAIKHYNFRRRHNKKYD